MSALTLGVGQEVMAISRSSHVRSRPTVSGDGQPAALSRLFCPEVSGGVCAEAVKEIIGRSMGF